MSDSKYKTGMRVRVVIDGEIGGVAYDLRAAVRYDSSGAGFVKVRDQHGTFHYIWVNDREPGSVELTEPANWPPQLGDVWQLPDGTEFFARCNTCNYDRLVLVADRSDDVRSNFYDSEFETFKALGPVLVRRK
jgi:hypothetical protein